MASRNSLKNKIINYYVIPELKPHVIKSPITIGADVAAKLYRQEMGEGAELGNFVHACYDLSSGLIYTPNAHEFSNDQVTLALQAIRIRITKDYGSCPDNKNINGSPFTSYRKRSIEHFDFVKNAAAKHFEKEVFDIPIIEANLGRMPTTLKSLPDIFTSPNCTGSYISPKDIKKIDFIDEFKGDGRKREKPILVDSVTTPCIIINTDPDKKVKAYDKEWTALSGYRDFLYDKSIFLHQDTEDLNSFSFIYACKIHMYFGWTFQEVCEVLLDSVNNFPELIKAIQNLMIAAYQLEQEGYVNPARHKYITSFMTDKAYFPFQIDSICSDGKIDSAKQIPNFSILEYSKNDFVTIESPVFINEKLCKKILKCFNHPIVTQYSPITKKIEIKTEGSLSNYSKNHSKQLNKIKFYMADIYNLDVNKMEFIENKQTTNVSKSDNKNYSLRKISDYYYVTDYAKKICEKEGVHFEDIDVLVGPIGDIFGQGTMGGFSAMPSKETIEKNKMTFPYEIVKDIFVKPPYISINSKEMTSYSDQTETLIHEYRHFVFSKTNPNYKHKYNTDWGNELKKKDNLRWWDVYLSDIDERFAHKIQIEFQLKSGCTADELISEKVGGVITEDNYPIALKYKKLIDEVEEDIFKKERE